MSERPAEIPFNRPTASEKEQAYLRDALTSGRWSGDGTFARKSERVLENELGVRRALLVTSCTHALEMSAMLLDLHEGDEVIVPSFTFVSTANAFVMRGAKPVFCDVRADTLNLDETKLEALVTKNTRAVVPVHYAGVGCDMTAICEIASRHGLTVIEDNAHGLFGTFRGKPLGSFGALATQSFHDTKNFACGEGGALLVNDEALIERAEILREKGTDRSRFFRGQVDKYTWVDVGSSYVLSDLLAAILLGQLERREEIQSARRRVFEAYANGLSQWAAERDIRLPVIPADCGQTYHMFYLVMPSLARRTAFIEHLKARGAHAVFHYQALNISPMGRRFGARDGDCPVAEAMSDRLVRLPMFASLSPTEIETVISACRAFD
jgi:dTDP-4-amino-4,6-dideoxygalactose transaminase